MQRICRIIQLLLKTNNSLPTKDQLLQCGCVEKLSKEKTIKQVELNNLTNWFYDTEATLLVNRGFADQTSVPRRGRGIVFFNNSSYRGQVHKYRRECTQKSFYDEVFVAIRPLLRLSTHKTEETKEADYQSSNNGLS